MDSELDYFLITLIYFIFLSKVLTIKKADMRTQGMCCVSLFLMQRLLCV